jgi:cell wall-associated NlpC family hydrolase
LPVYIDRDTYSKWNSEAIGQQADLIKEDIAAAPPLPSTESPSPPPAAPAFQPPTPSDALTQPVPRATPGPPALTDLLAAAGLAESPSPSAGGAASGAQPGAAPAPSGGIPSLDSLLQSAGLGDVGGAVGGAVSGAAQTVASAAPPPLDSLMRSAGLLDQPKPAQQPSQAALVPTAAPQDIMARVQPFLGSGYVWGGKDPNTGFDCSGLAGYLAGTGQPESTTTLYGKSAGIDSKDLKPGDLVFYNMGQSDMHLQHVGTYIGGGKLVQAGGSQNTVNIADINQQIGSAPEFRRMNAGTTKPTEGVPAQVASAAGQAVTGAAQAGAAAALGASKQVSDMIDQAAQAGGVAPSLLAAVVKQESGFSQTNADGRTKTSPAGALGLAQLMPDTARGLGVDPHDAMQNLIGGARYLKQLLDQFGGDVTKAIAAYNAGPGAVQRYGGTPPYDETQNYVRIVSDNLSRAQQAAGGTVASAAGAVQGAAQSTFADLAQSGGNLAQQGAALAQGLAQPLGESPTAAVEREANQRMASLQATLNTSLQGGQQAQDQRSVQASTIGGGLAGRGAVNVTDAGGGLTPEQLMMSGAAPIPPQGAGAGSTTAASGGSPSEPPKPLWAQIGDTIGSAISQGLQPLMQAIQGGPAPASQSAMPPEGGGYGATGLAPVEQTGPIGQAAIGAGQVAQQVQTPEAGSVPLGAVGQAIGTGASALGTVLHAGQEAIRHVSPVSGAARTVAGSDEYARQYAALGGVDLEREYRDLVQRRLNGEDGLEPRIQQIGDQLNTINAQITQGQPYEAAISQAAEQNPAFPAIETAANVGAAGLALPLAAEGAPLAARVLAEVLQPGTNPLEVARGAFELVRGADAADPGTEQAVRAAWESFGQRWTDSAAQRERMLSQIGDPRGFLERVRDNLASAGGAVARGAQGAIEDLSRPTRGGVVGEAPAAANADRFYHGTGSDFPSPDAAKFDPNGLFGPGYYVTSDPRVAGGVVDEGGGIGSVGYSQNRSFALTSPPATQVSWTDTADILRTVAQQPKIPDDIRPWLSMVAQRAEGGASSGYTSPSALLDFVQQNVNKRTWREINDAVEARVPPPVSGPNVRAVDVPKNLNLLDVDALAPAGLVDRVRKQVGLEGAGFDVQDHLDGLPQKPTGQDVWQAINAGGGGERDYPNAVLQALGFDGIRYEGGKRIPLADQAGQPIEHTAVVVFPESLDKLRNATAGTRGGLLPDVAGENLARQVATRAAVGGTGAGIQESQDPNATPGDIARAAAQGAVLGGARPLVGRAIPGLRIAPEVGRIAQLIGGPPGNPRSFDLNVLRQWRQQQAAQAAPVVQPARVATPLDRFIGYTAANMLSGIGTAISNTLGNFAQMATRPVITTAAGYPSDAMRDVATMAASLSDAFAAYGRTFVIGQRTGAHYQANPGSLLNPLTYPLRNLGATDEFFRTLNGNGAAAAEASRRLRENPNLTFAQVLQQHGNDIADAAADGAARAVFEQGGGLAGWFGEWVGRGRTNLLQSADTREQGMGLILQWLMPMTRVPGVILGEGIRGLPVVNEVRGLQRTAQLAMQGDTRAARMEFSRTYLTSFANFAILSEVAQGNITGDGPTSPADKARLMEAVDKDGNAVWRPNSVRLPGGRWLDYSGLGPIALSMSSIANLVDTATDYAQKSPEQRGDMPQLAKELLNREARTIGNAWYLKGLADVLSGIKEGTIGGTASSITQLADRLVPAESLMNELRRMEDPYARDPQNVVQREASRLPFASRTVQPRLTATTGQPEEQPRDLVATLLRGTPGGMMTPNPVATEIARLTDAGERVTVPYEQKTYAGAAQSAEQQRTIREQTGDAVRLYVLNTMNQPAYAKLTDAQKADALKKAVGQAQEASNLTLSGQVARSPHEAALMQWAQTPQYAGVSSRLPPEQIARANWEIEQARSKLSDYRKQYGEQAENRLRRDDATTYRLSQRDRIDKEVLDRKKKAIDKATGGALTQTADTAAAGGLVGVGGTVLRP